MVASTSNTSENKSDSERIALLSDAAISTKGQIVSIRKEFADFKGSMKKQVLELVSIMSGSAGNNMNIDGDNNASTSPPIAKKKEWKYTPFLNHVPTPQYNGQGICFDGVVFHFNAGARGNKGGWYSDYVPPDIKDSVSFPNDWNDETADTILYPKRENNGNTNSRKRGSRNYDGRSTTRRRTDNQHDTKSSNGIDRLHALCALLK